MQTTVELQPGSGFELASVDPDPRAEEHVFELGLLFSALGDFLATDGTFFGGGFAAGPVSDLTREVRLVRALLLRCSEVNFRLRLVVGNGAVCGVDPFDLDRITPLVRDLVVSAETAAAAGGVSPARWMVFAGSALDRLDREPSAQRAASASAVLASSYFPARIGELIDSSPLADSDKADLRTVVSRIARLLRALRWVEKLLEKDAPVKRGLVVMAHVFFQTRELIDHLDGRVSRFADQSSELCGLLDGASYTASLELKKVFGEELSGVIAVRPAPTVYARMETACALLSESFQQVLTGFARLIDPTIKALDLFPALGTKLDQSLKLRAHLWQVMNLVRAAERSPESKVIGEVRADLESFLGETLGYLFYKDRETFERFCEEVNATGESRELVPILHAFGAYLETLLGQVNMRNVLADHPFEPTSV